MKTTEPVRKLFLGYILELLSPEEETALNNWRSLSPEHEAFFQKTTDKVKIREGLRRITESKDVVWKKIRERYPMSKDLSPEPARNEKLFYRFIAAAAVLLVIIAQWWLDPGDRVIIKPGTEEAVYFDERGVEYNTLNLANGTVNRNRAVSLAALPDGDRVLVVHSHSASSKEASQQIKTPRGGRFRLTLPGVLNAWLDAESSIKFPVDYKNRMIELELSGRALIAMNKNAADSMRFHVGNIYLLGTRAQFEAHYYPDEFLTIRLLNGSLRWSADPLALHSDTAHTLAPAEQISFEKNPPETSITDSAAVLALKNNITYFKNAGLQRIMKELSRWYNVEYEIRGDWSQKTFSLDLSRTISFAGVMKRLARQGVHYKMLDGKLIIYP